MTESRWTAVWLGMISGLCVAILLPHFPWLSAVAVAGLPAYFAWLSYRLGMFGGGR